MEDSPIVDLHDKRFIGRKLYVKWGEHMYIAIEKIPAGDDKLLEMKTYDTELLLCNVYRDPKTGKVLEEVLGAPYKKTEGCELAYIFTEPKFWMTPSEGEKQKC